MQNLKQMEDYKKERMAKISSEEPIPDDSLETTLELGDEDVEFPQESPNEIEMGSSENKPYMVLANLKKICDQSNQLIGMIQSSGKVDPWAVDHIATSADDIEEVYNYYKYRD